MTETFVDARGLKCPWPALRLARAMRSFSRIIIAADDPQASAEFRALAAERGWSILEEDAKFVVERPVETKS